MRGRRLPCLLLIVAGCGVESLPAGECQLDTDCGGGRVCHQTECIPPAKLACAEGGSTQAHLEVRPLTVEFGAVAGAPVEQTVELESTGDCTLQLRAVTVAGGPTSRFACASCAEVALPRDVLPGRTLSLDLLVAPGPPASLADTLIVSSSDLDRPERSIPLSAESVGRPALVVTPHAIDFGYVPVGRTGEGVVQVINASEGTAPLGIDAVTLAGSSAFSFTPSPLSPLELPAAREEPSARLALMVRYAPAMNDVHTATLTVTPATGDPVLVILSGAKDPPDVSVMPAAIDFGSVPLGMTASGHVTLQNTGRSPLIAERHLQIGHPDLSVPRPIPHIRPGGVYQLDVVYQVTLSGPMSDTLLIETNDPDLPMISIPLSGSGQAAPGSDVVALELSFDNDSDTFLDADLRDVDLILESPDGRVCRKMDPAPDWGAYGHPRWSAQGTKDNPERILLPDAMQDGRYPVTLSYLEDCSTLPTALAAALLGLGADQLIDYLSNGGTSIDPDLLANAVAETCLNRSTPNATVTVTINGAVADQRPVDLRAKGDLAPALTLVRANGVFSIE